MGKVNWWTKLLSYIAEYPLERVASEHNEELLVLLRNGRHQLCTPNAIYSYDDLYNNFSESLAKIHIKERPIEEVLVLGLGLGSIPLLLEKSFDLAPHITAVEIDEEVIYLANKYVLQNLKSPIDCICTDARVFLQLDPKLYDLICMDVFKDDIIPATFRGVDFLEDLQAHLKKEGILLFNHLALTSHDKKEAQAYFEEIFIKVFPNASIIDTRSNYVLLNDSKFLKEL